MGTKALVIIDMQKGLLPSGDEDAEALVDRIAELATRLRRKQVPIFFIQHCGPEGHPLHPHEPGHSIHAALLVEPGDVVLKKRFCDSFLETELASTLSELKVNQLIITGCTTEFCVDTTIRSALARGFSTVVPKDGHTTFNRQHVSAQTIIDHHNALWENFISPAGAARLTHCAGIS
jgi:nicotinamidase-related amidase